MVKDVNYHINGVPIPKQNKLKLSFYKGFEMETETEVTPILTTSVQGDQGSLPPSTGGSSLNGNLSASGPGETQEQCGTQPGHAHNHRAPRLHCVLGVKAAAHAVF